MVRLLMLLSIIAAGAMGMVAGAWWTSSTSGEKVAMASAEDVESKPLWTCGMHPQVIRNEPGLCPICHMALTPVAAEAGAGGWVVIDPRIVQNMGVRTAEAVRGPVVREIRALGTVSYDQTQVRDVYVKLPGRIDKLYVNYLGAPVEVGEPLFELDSPDLFETQRAFALARRSLVGWEYRAAEAAGRIRLKYFGLTDEQIDQIHTINDMSKIITVRSPQRGVVIEKDIYEGSTVEADMRVMRIADLSKVWVMVQVYEQDLPFAAVDARATMSLPYLPGRTFEGHVTYIYPEVDEQTRTAMARLEFENPDGLLKPGMYATVSIEAEIADEAPLIPDEAVIDTGLRKIVFVSLGEGKFEPRDVKTGLSGDDGTVQVLEGLVVGETVVTSGQFLLDAESRMREAIRKYLSQSGASSDGKAAPPPAHQH